MFNLDQPIPKIVGATRKTGRNYYLRINYTLTVYKPMLKNAIVEIKEPFNVTLNSTQEVKKFEAGWLARIENDQLVVGVEHSTYKGNRSMKNQLKALSTAG